MESQTTTDSKLKTSIVKKICNDYLSISVAKNGLFNSCGADTVTEEPYNIIFSSKDSFSTSFTTIKIDDVNFVYGLIGKMIQEPTEFPELKNESTYKYINNIEVKQTLQIIKNTFTDYDDIGRYKYTVTNNDNVDHSIGIRIMIDTMIKDNDGVSFIIPNKGTITYEREFTGKDIPKFWEGLNSLDNQNILTKGILIGEKAARPDRFVIAAWPNIKVTTWDYEVNNSLPITTDSAVAIYWNPVVIKPGESHDFTTFYGLSTVSQGNKPEEPNFKTNNMEINSITRGINILRFYIK